jgi:NAD(P)-dependent dehydrogenase (short-subunit alcohol dehydrogenase family)
LATALRFARDGTSVAIVGRREEANKAARRQVEALGAKCLDFAGDVTDERFMHRTVAEAADGFGGLHFAFNNAGVEQGPSPLPQQSIADYRQIIDVNIIGVWLAMRDEIPAIQRSGGGCVVNTSSIFGLIGMAQIPLYAASKHAVIGLTKAAALEYAKQGVRVNAVCPGAVRTDLYNRFTGKKPQMEQVVEAMHPMGRNGTPEEVASAVYWLCTEATWTTGQSIVMDGGFTVR